MRWLPLLTALLLGCLGAEGSRHTGGGPAAGDLGPADQGAVGDLDGDLAGLDLAKRDGGDPTLDAGGVDQGGLPEGTVRLNEVACRGDEWIELYNPRPYEALLSGWTLSDDPSRPEHRLALEGQVPAQGYRVIGAAAGLPFGVACSGDTLLLLGPQDRLVDLVATEDPGEDLTWGRWPDGDGPWGATAPTRGAANRLPAAGRVRINEVDCRGRDWVELHNAADEVVPLAGWTLSDSEDPAPGWTLPAGTRIAAQGFVVLRQQDVDEAGFSFGLACGRDTVVLRDPSGAPVDSVALPSPPRAFTWGRLPDGGEAFAVTEPSPGEPNRAPADEAAPLFDPSVLQRVDLRIDETQMESLRREPYGEVPGQLRLRQGADSPWLAVGIRVKGRAGSLRSIDDKPSLKVDLNEVVPGQRLLGQKKLTFNNMVQDPSMIHEWLAYDLFRGAGLPAPRVGYARLTLNGLDYGLYAILEPMDDDWLDRHFASTEHLYEGMYGMDLFPEQVEQFEVDSGDPGDRSDLRELIALADATEPARFHAASAELVGWDSVARFMALELYIGHWDGYAATRNNYYFHFDREGRATLLPWGTDQTFDAELGIHDGQGRLLQLCLASPECRQGYDRSLLALLEQLRPGPLLARVEAQAERVGAWAADDPRRPYVEEHRRAVVQRTLEFLRTRWDRVSDLLRCLTGPDADRDGDGFACDSDCNNDDASVHPGAVDLCGDGVDQDCNGWPDDGPDCPDCVERQLDGRRYLVCPSPRTWEEGRLECEEHGSQMAIVSSARENDWLFRQARALRPNLYWIGLSDQAEEGDFRWVDGSALSFAAWAGGEPNDAGGNEDCAHLWTDAPTWNDIPCEERLGTLCEDPCADPEDRRDRDGDGVSVCNGDCDDDAPGTFPGAAEVCADGVDQDCSGQADDWPCGLGAQPEEEPNQPEPLCNQLPAGGALVTGELAGDRDWFCIELQPGQTLVLDIDAQNGPNRPPHSNLDAYLLLHFSGELVGQNDDADGLDSALRHRSEEGGHYAIEVASCCVGDGSPGGFYTLRVGVE